ncbi:protein with RING/U-box and TRAF-like domain [Actinidia rufa]|uniref:RING-type E3 ubiquitin transferase n=1 Tax=Actinidia rufa TaxID=165716 RepID=A0A7J0F2E6_9ERIC|nr:protein with RING/U-box and TRAF-like domain [Actinidia rufa]
MYADFKFLFIPNEFPNSKPHNNVVCSAIHPTKSVHELLECPVCTNSMYPPIHQCHNGHTLCSTCKARVHNCCPTCRQELGDIRCLALEKVAESLELPCKYYSLGCPEIFPYYSKLKHESICNFRPYNCPYAGSECSVVGDIPYLVAHLRDDHKVDMHSGCTFNHRYVKSNPREVENATWMLTVFNCFGQYFCPHFEAFQLRMAPVYMAFLRFSWATRWMPEITVIALRWGEMAENSFGRALRGVLEIVTGRPQFSSTVSIFSPKYSLTALRNKNPYRFSILSRNPPPFSTRFSLSATRKLRISSHPGRPTNRRNSLRKKLTQQQQQKQFWAMIVLEESRLNSNYGVNEGVVSSDNVEESESKLLVDSVLRDKLGNWADQYETDSAFWGIGFSPIFTVFQDSESNVKRVVVNEDEILKRSGIEPELYKKSGLEDLTKVDSKISHAKFLAGEMERGNYVFPKNSSVTKFVVSGRQWGFVNSIRGFTVRPGLSLKLPRIEITVLCGFFVLLAMKRLFAGMKRKGKAHEKKHQLVDWNYRNLLVIRVMLRISIVKFRKLEQWQGGHERLRKQGSSPVVEQAGEDASLPNDLSDEYSSQTRSLMPTSFSDLKREDNVFSEKALVENSRQTNQRKVSVKIREVICSVKEAREFLSLKNVSSKQPSQELEDRTEPKGAAILSLEQEKESSSNVMQRLDKDIEVTDTTILDGTSDFALAINDGNDAALKREESAYEPEGAAILSLEREKESGSNARQILHNDIEVTGTTTLDGISDFAPAINDCDDSVLKRKKSVSTVKKDTEVADEGHEVNGLQMPRALGHEANIGNADTGPSVLVSPGEREMGNNTSWGLDEDNKVFQPTILGGPSDSASDVSACRGSTLKTKKDDDYDNVEQGYQKPPTSVVRESNGISTETIPSMNKENWMEENFHTLEPFVKKIGSGFRDNYMTAREKVEQGFDLNTEMRRLGMIHFHLMGDEDKLAFFEGLERKVDKENEKLSILHGWLHSNIENLDYGADGISLYDPPEKIIPRWKGPPVDKIHEFLNNTVTARNSANLDIERADGQTSLQKFEELPSNESIVSASAGNDQNLQIRNGASKISKTVIEGSDGSVRAGKKSGKEYWQHTKKWSRGFLECYNAESDPEIKAVLKDVGKDLDRWITEKEIQEAGDLMGKLPKRGRQFLEKRLSKVKREMELFGQQAVMSKYREYAEEKQEDYLWWLDLPYVLCIELYTHENEEPKIGLYSLEMAADLELDPKQYHVIAFEDPGDCKNLCYIIQAHMEMLGSGKAFVVAQPPKDAFREAKANGFSVTVIRKRELQLNVDQTLEEVEEQISEIGSKIYHDKIMQERGMDVNLLTKGVLNASKPPKRNESLKAFLEILNGISVCTSNLKPSPSYSSTSQLLFSSIASAAVPVTVLSEVKYVDL